MKKIVCELCEGTEFTKDGGMFVCQGCGTKYSAEEARNMMREADGDATPDRNLVIGVPMSNPNQQQIDNMLILATNAFEADNNKEAENYCNQVIALDAMNYKAWLLKGKAAGWQSTLQNQRITEAAHSFAQAIDLALEEEKDAVKEEAVEQLKRLGLACISLRTKRFSQYPDEEELNGFTNDRKILLDALMVLLSKGIATGIPEGYEKEIASMMNQAAVAGFSKVRNEYNDENRPMPRDFDKALKEADNCIVLIKSAIDASEDDDEEDITRYENLVIIEQFTIDMTAYPDYNSYSGRSWMLTDESKKIRRGRIDSYKSKISQIKKDIEKKKKVAERKAEEEKQARIRAYWEAHADEKAALDAEKKQLTEKKTALDAKLAELDKSISACKNVEKTKVSSEEETDKLKTQIKELEDRRSNLGMFAGKEKKQIGEEIASLQGRIESLKSKIADEKRIKSEEVQKKIAPMQKERDELDAERTKVTKRITAIDAELTKDPEA